MSGHLPPPGLAGHLRLRPGRARPDNLHSTRQDWLARLAPGQPADQLPALAGRLFSLCGQAQRLCASLAVQAACGQPAGEDHAQALAALHEETLREHLRRILLDWPRQLGGEPAHAVQAANALASCPALRRPGSGLGELPQWLAHHLLGQPAERWLSAWELRPETHLRQWCDTHDGWLPRLLGQARAWTDQAQAASPLLPWPDEAAAQALARRLATEHRFSSQPDWQGQCAETGPWSRRHTHPAQTLAPATPWLRLGARLAELVRLALPDEAGRCGCGWLQTAQWPIGPGEGLAAVEMARGLLVHRVRLSRADTQARVLDCQVLAPTEWNFHPRGSVAQALEAWPAHAAPDRVQAQVQALICAYDPCVSYEMEAPQHA
ncbi:MAG: hypothetical protein JZU58_07250 [Curvibacter lanceolatus]|jgi:hypothetical protein|uniref:hypothetical protein n=1 Tax=Curvibacter lanceolatus TaxID=86182 RepID=UPI002357FC18|nr:hypothetical protein [Curvibacter lanceolatus]MBV5292134.1 hypothetical protein [Curvibacter lanceolatus]